jgi:hypothetical protein
MKHIQPLQTKAMSEIIFSYIDSLSGIRSPANLETNYKLPPPIVKYS